MTVYHWIAFGLIAFMLLIMLVMVACQLYAWWEGRPPETLEMKQRGLTWGKLNGEWIQVCDTCGGNCGQCGSSVAMGIPPQMDRLIKHIT